ncbi:MAG: hypothetical protein H7A23_14035 [Leptospiraceae bacterium]|nr:hypothetical protein [Leptospiraceae bacterium]
MELPQSLPEVTVDANGKANMVIDIELPASNAFQPQVQLAYNSNTENGIFGVGWQMPSLHTISRLEVAGVHYDSEDRFISSLGGKLTSIQPLQAYSVTDGYSIFTPSGTCGVGPCQWTVTDKNGIKYYFGHTADSRIETLNLPTGKSGSVKIWALNKVEDPNGNFYTISYTKDTSGFYYPKTINYSDKTIEFTLSTRSDTNIEYAENINLGMNKIVTGIKITSAGETFRDYTLHYEVGSSKRSKLSKVSLAGYKDLSLSYTETVKTLKKLDNVSGSVHLDYRVPFYNQAKCDEIKSYCDCSASSACRAAAAKLGKDVREECAEGVALMGDYCILGMQMGPMIFMDDVDKDGKTDLIKITGGKNDNHISVAKITETQYQEYPASPAWQLRINSFVSTADIDGDGAKELWIAEENGKTLKIVKPSNYVFNQVSDTGLVIDNIGYDPNNMKLTSNNFAIDMDADGRTDFVMVYDSPNENKTRFKIYLSNGTGFSSNPIQIETGYADSENSLRFLSDIDSDQKPEWITINKNSLDKMVVHRIDITTATASSSEYGFALGSTNYKNVSFADVNRDGKVDILAILENGDVSVCLFTGDGFTQERMSLILLTPNRNF